MTIRSKASEVSDDTEYINIESDADPKGDQ